MESQELQYSQTLNEAIFNTGEVYEEISKLIDEQPRYLYSIYPHVYLSIYISSTLPIFFLLVAKLLYNISFVSPYDRQSSVINELGDMIFIFLAFTTFILEIP